MNRLTLWFRVQASRPRRGIRRLQQYANCRTTRPLLDHFHKPRKEDRS